MDNKITNNLGNVSCRKCKHFVVTWDIKQPYGCKAFDFKSKQIPSIEVYKASGKECMKFLNKDFEQKK